MEDGVGRGKEAARTARCGNYQGFFVKTCRVDPSKHVMYVG